MPLPVLSWAHKGNAAQDNMHHFLTWAVAFCRAQGHFSTRQSCVCHMGQTGDTNTGHKPFNSACSYKTFSRLQKNISFIISEEPGNIFIFNNMHGKMTRARIRWKQLLNCDSWELQQSLDVCIQAQHLCCCLRQQRDVVERHSNLSGNYKHVAHVFSVDHCSEKAAER